MDGWMDPSGFFLVEALSNTLGRQCPVDLSLSPSTSPGKQFAIATAKGESMAARNLIPCVTIRRAESTGEDPIYTCATDEDTASRGAPRWERSTAPPPPLAAATGDGQSAPVDRAHGAGAGGKAWGGRAGRSRGRGEPIGGAEIGKRRGPPRANIFSPPSPARGLCGRAPTRGSRQVDMHLAPFTCHMAQHGRPRRHSSARSGARPGSSV
jgi:hypothetical protein